MIPSREEIQERIEKATRSRWRPILVVASDGAHLPTRPKAPRKGKRGPGQWQEAKGFRIYLMGVDSIIHLAGWHQIQNEEGFGKDLALAASRIPQDQVRISLLGDGADWLWKHMTACFPEGREILDTRLKRSGAWWIKENGNAMLRIRCALYNGTYDRVFDHYKKAHLNQKRVSKLKNG